MLEVNSGSTPEVIAPILSPETYLTSKKISEHRCISNHYMQIIATATPGDFITTKYATNTTKIA
jgi:hypothetical protein